MPFLFILQKSSFCSDYNSYLLYNIWWDIKYKENKSQPKSKKKEKSKEKTHPVGVCVCVIAAIK